MIVEKILAKEYMGTRPIRFGYGCRVSEKPRMKSRLSS